MFVFNFFIFRFLSSVFFIVLVLRITENYSSTLLGTILIIFSIPLIILFVFGMRSTNNKKIDNFFDTLDAWAPHRWAMPWIIMVMFLSAIFTLVG